MYNEKATKIYTQTQIEIQTEIEKLQDILDKHNEQAICLHWEHVGDMRFVLAQLKELTQDDWPHTIRSNE
jgi:hypothetical protein